MIFFINLINVIILPQEKKTLEKEAEGESGRTERREVNDTEGKSKDHLKVVRCEDSSSEGHQSEDNSKDSNTEVSSKDPRSEIDEVTKNDKDHKVTESEGHKSIRSDCREVTKSDENRKVTKSDEVTRSEDDRSVSRAMMLLEGSSETSHAMGAYHMNSHAMQERVRNFVLSRRKSSETEKSRERGEEHTTISNGIGLSISHMLKQEPNNNEHHFISPQQIADDRMPSGDSYNKLHHRTSALDDSPHGESVITMRMSHRCYGDRSPLPERHRHLHHHHHHHHHRGVVHHSQIPEAHSMKRRHNGYFSCSLSPVANGYYGPPSPGGIVKCDDVPIPLKKVSEYKDMVAGGNCVDMTMSVMSLSVAARGIIQYQTGTGCDRDHLFTGVSELSLTSE